MNLLNQFKDYLFSQDKKASNLTVKNYASDVSHFLRWFEQTYSKTFAPKEVTKTTIEEYRTQVSNVFSASSMDRHLSALRKFFTFLKLEGLISLDPFQPLIADVEALAKADPWRIKDFKNFLYVYSASHLTIKNYLIDIKQFLAWAQESLGLSAAAGNLDLNFVNSDLVEDYKQKLLTQGNFSPATINRKLSSLRKYLSWAQAEGLVSGISYQVSGIQKAAEVKAYIPESKEIPNTKYQIPNTKYSSFPPLRLAQKISKAVSFLFDSLIIAPLALAVEKTDYALWKVKGQPVFKRLKKSNLTSYILNHKSIFEIKNLKKESYAPSEISTKYFPWPKKMWFNLRYNRPKWYKTYHSYPITHYFHFAVLIIFLMTISFGFYNAFFQKGNQSPLLAAGPTAPPRILSFQGRLTDNNDNPITSATALRFTIYDSLTASAGGDLLWQEVDSVTPDQDGIFNTLLGNNAPIPPDLFANNSALWLGVTVGSTPELAPRQPLASVAFATNSEFLQGMAPTTQAGLTTYNNTVLALDSSGNLSIGAGVVTANPTFQANGSFKLSGQPLLLTTNAGSNANVMIAPDGLGQIDLQSPLQNSTNNNNIGIASGAVEVDDMLAVLATSSAGQPAFTINQNGSGPLFVASTSGINKFLVDSAGNLFAAGSATFSGNLGVGGNGNFSGNLTSGGNLILSNSAATTTFGGITYTWPTSIAQNNYVLQTQTNGSLAWVAQNSAGGVNFWQELSGALSPIRTADDLLLGGSSTNSAAFAFTGLMGNQTQASFSGNLIVMPNNGYGGKVGIGTTIPNAKLTIDSTSTPASAELITDGDFTLDPATHNWTLGDCVTWGSGTVTALYTSCSDTSASTTFSSTAGKTYLLSFDLTTNGNHMYYYFNNNSLNFDEGPFEAGHHTVAFKTNYTGVDTIWFDSWDRLNATGWTIDNVSIRETNDIIPALTVKGYDGSTWLSLGGNLLANTALGKSSFQSNTSGAQNAAFGNAGLNANTSGWNNGAFGNQALFSNTTGMDNNAFGNQALFSNINGQTNSAFGEQALYSNTGGGNNEAFGWQALQSNTTGWNNVAIGRAALASNTTGSNNVALGGSAGGGALGDGNVFLGYNAGSTETGSNKLYIANNSTTPLIYGDFSTGEITFPHYATCTLTTNGSGLITCGSGGAGGGFWQELSGALSPSTSSDDLLLGGSTTASAKFAFTGLMGNQTQASFSGNLIVMPNNGFGGNVGIGTITPSQSLEVAGNGLFSTTNTTTEDFEGSFLPTGWTTGGDANWAQDNTQYISGFNSAASGAILEGQSSWIETSHTFAKDGTISFWWQVNADASNYYYLGYCVDNDVHCNDTDWGYNETLSGTTYWKKVIVPVAAGAHTIRWIYVKEVGSSPVGSDKGWIDDVQFIEGGNTTAQNFIANGYVNINSSGGNPSDGYKINNQTVLNYYDNSNSLAIGNGATLTYDSIAIGAYALKNGGGSSNIGIGSFALAGSNGSTGSNNIAMGYQSLTNNFGLSNNAYGYRTLRYNTNGNNNNAFGYQALRSNIYGNSNNAFGSSALFSNTTGSNNVAVGESAGYNSLGSGNVFLGFQAGYSETGSNKLYIANNSTTTLIYGDFATGEITFPHYATCTLTTNGSGLITCGSGGAGGGFWQELSGALSPIQLNDDLLLGGSTTASAKFAFTGLMGNQTQASMSGNLIVMPNNGFGGNASVSGNLTLGIYGTGAIQTTKNQLLTIGGNTTGDIQFKPGNSSTGLYLSSGGNVGIGTLSPLVTLDIRGNSGTLAAASISAKTSFAGMVVDNQGIGDLFTASASGLTRFVIQNNGNVGIGTSNPANFKLQVAGNIGPDIDNTYNLGSSPSGRFASLFLGPASLHIQCKTTDAGCPSSQGIDYSLGINPAGTFGIGANLNSNLAAPFNITQGGNVGIGTTAPTAVLDVAGTASFGGVLKFRSGFGAIQTTADQNLILGGDTTGQITLKAFNGLTSSGIAFTGYNTCTLKTDGSGNITCGVDLTAAGVPSPFVEITGTNGGFIMENNTTEDFLLGGNSTASAKFAFTGLMGNQTQASMSGNLIVMPNNGYGGNASVSGNLTLGIYGTGAIQTTKNQLLTIGGNTTGDIQFKPGNSSTGLYLSSGGNVGIGTTAPLVTFDVRGNSATTPIASLSGSTNFAGLVVDNSGNGDLITASSSGITQFKLDNTGNLTTNKFIDFSDSRYYLDPANGGVSLLTSGSVGIGTLTPTTTLDVAGSASLSGNLAFTGTSTNRILIQNGSNLYFATSPGGGLGSNRMAILATGNVGIGTTSPGTARLDVSGNVGINNSSPRASLDIVGNASMSGYLYFGATAGAGSFIRTLNGNDFYFTTSPGGSETSTTQMTLHSNGALSLNDTPLYFRSDGGIDVNHGIQYDTTTNGPILYGYNAVGIGTIDSSHVYNPHMFIRYDGKVGIGTTSPNALLTVKGTGTGVIDMGQWPGSNVYGAIYLNNQFSTAASYNLLGDSSDNNFFLNRPTGGGIYFRENNVDQMTILTGGNVGIGKTPTTGYNLDVSGTIRSTGGTDGYLYADGTAGGEIQITKSGTSKWAIGTDVAEANDNLNFYNYVTGSINFKLDSAGGLVYANIASNTSTSLLCKSHSGGGLAYLLVCNGAGQNDFTEWTRGPTIEPGDIVKADPNMPDQQKMNPADRILTSVKSTQAYDPNVIGIVSEWGTGLDRRNGNFPDDKQLSISGVVAVKASLENGIIHKGDSIVASSTPGVGMKSTKAGIIVGKALEDFDGSGATQSAKLINGHWQTVSATCQPGEQNCYNQGRLLVLLNVGWYDPQVYLTTTGDLNLVDQTATDSAFTVPHYFTLNDALGNPLQRVGEFSDAVIANLKVGLVSAQQVTTQALSVATDNVTIAGQSLHDYIASIVSSILSSSSRLQGVALEAQSIISPIASIDELHTNFISPIDNNSNISVSLQDSKFIIHDSKSATGSAVAVFDNQGNASFSGQLTSNSLNTGDATISGTLHAGKILASDIVGLASSSATYVTNVTNIYNSTASAAGTSNPTGLGNSNFGLIAGAATVGTGSSILNSQFSILNSGNYIDISSFSGQLTYIENLSAATATFSQGLMSYGPTSLSDTSVVGQLSINGSLILANNSINVLGSDLNLQPLRQGGISLMGGLVYFDTEGNLKVGGNAEFAKNVTVKGTLAAGVISPLPGNDLNINLPSGQIHNSEFIIHNSSGSAVLSINPLGDLVASGAATIAKLNLSLVQPALALSPTELIATGSAGTAQITPYQTQVTIDNALVTDKSLIYITPTSSTNNQVLYLLRQTPNMNGTGGSFTVGLQNPSIAPIPFNWIIVN